MRIKYSLILSVFVFASCVVSAQDVNDNLSNAESSYNSGDLENARFELQEALNGIYQALGKDILEMLPASLEDMMVVEGSDEVVGTNVGFAGLFVNREYIGEQKNARFEIVSDSPLLGSINSLLTMSVFFAADPNQKRIKVDGYKALLTKSESEDGTVSYDIQMPFGSSLMTFGTEGIPDEDKVTGLFESLPVSDIIALAE